MTTVLLTEYLLSKARVPDLLCQDYRSYISLVVFLKHLRLLSVLLHSSAFSEWNYPSSQLPELQVVTLRIKYIK